MFALTQRHQQIVQQMKIKPESSFSELFAVLASETSERTLKRDLTELVTAGILTTRGGGRSLTYLLSAQGRFFAPIEVASYGASEPDTRIGALTSYQFDVWEIWPDIIFSNNERSTLDHNTDIFKTRTRSQSPDVQAKEIERFIIELSWKSSRIEGNTYTLLDTERLLRDGIPSKTNTQEETTMILNHKTAFKFVLEQSSHEATLTRSFIEHTHTLLMANLLKDMGLRKNAVGITGSTYRPLDNQFQIAEELDNCITRINGLDSGYEKAVTALIGISYLQPFVDGNKRTARLIANALLLRHKLAPLSYRNVDEVMYRAALLAFYEQLSIIPMKQIFIEQYLFASEHYS